MTEIAKIERAEVQRPADPMVSMIERIAMDPNSDLAKLEQMLAMKERMEDRAREDEDREARRTFFADLVRAQSGIPVVFKNKSNAQTRSNYADLAAIEEQAMPVIRECGFAISAWPVPGANAGSQRVRFRVSHSAGHTDELEDDFALDGAGIKGTQNKTDLHAKASTVSYARRYFLTGYFNIATADDDGNAGGGRASAHVTPDQYRQLRDLLDETGTDENKFKAAFGASNPAEVLLTEFPADKFQEAKRMLEAKKAKGGAK